MGNAIKSLTASLMLVIIGCYGNMDENSDGALGDFQPDVNLEASVFLTGENSLVIENNSAKVGQIVLIDEGITTKAKRIEKIDGENAIVSDAEIEEVFNDLVIQNQYPISDARQMKRSPANSRGNFYIDAKIQQINDEKGILFKFDNYPLLDQDGNKIEVGGQVFLENPKIELDYNMLSKRAILSVHIGKTNEIHLTANTKENFFFFEQELLLGNYVTPIIISGIPVCLVSYSLSLQIGVSGEVNIIARIEQTSAADVVLDISKTGITPSYNFNPPSEDDFSYHVQGNGILKTWVNLLPQVAFKILQYELAVLDGNLGTGAHGNLKVVNASEENDMTLELNCEVHAALWATFLQMDILTYDILDWSKDFTYEIDLLN